MNDYDFVCSESENGEFNENIFLFVDWLNGSCIQNGLKHLKDVIKVQFSVRKYSILRLKTTLKFLFVMTEQNKKSQKKNDWRSGKTLQWRESCCETFYHKLLRLDNFL